MSSNLPLYDTLYNEILSEEDLTDKEKKELVSSISKLDQDGHEIIYLLIRVYQLENTEDKTTFKIPFGGKFIKNDLEFHIDDLPMKLRHMLLKFVRIHMMKIIEEKTKEIKI